MNVTIIDTNKRSWLFHSFRASDRSVSLVWNKEKALSSLQVAQTLHYKVFYLRLHLTNISKSKLIITVTITTFQSQQQKRILLSIIRCSLFFSLLCWWWWLWKRSHRIRPLPRRQQQQQERRRPPCSIKTRDPDLPQQQLSLIFRCAP